MGAVTSKAGYGVDGSWGAGRPRRLSRRYNLADDLLGAGSGHGSGYGSEDGYGQGGEDGYGQGDGTGNGIACGKGDVRCYGIGLGIGLGHRRR